MTFVSFSTVIAGLDPAIQKTSHTANSCDRKLDCRVKPGNDNWGGGEGAASA
jgi:hypothetical protein